MRLGSLHMQKGENLGKGQIRVGTLQKIELCRCFDPAADNHRTGLRGRQERQIFRIGQKGDITWLRLIDGRHPLNFGLGIANNTGIDQSGKIAKFSHKIIPFL